jgi:hypothetical protein
MSLQVAGFFCESNRADWIGLRGRPDVDIRRNENLMQPTCQPLLYRAIGMLAFPNSAEKSMDKASIFAFTSTGQARVRLPTVQTGTVAVSLVKICNKD